MGGGNKGLTTGYVGAAGTNKGAWSGDGKNLGLTTGTTIYGNTAYGPSGGSAIGHAMAEPTAIPGKESYSQMMTPSGQPMFPGVHNQSFTAQNMGGAMAQARAASQRPSISPTAAPQIGRPAMRAAPPPRPVAPPVPRPSFRPVSPSITNMYGRNPTSYPQWTDGYHRPGSYPGPQLGGVDALRSSYRGPDPSIGAPAPGGSTMHMNNEGNTAGYGNGGGWGFRSEGSGWGPGAGDSLGPGIGDRWGY